MNPTPEARGAYDPNVTRMPASGSIKLLGKSASVQSAPVAITPGKTYTFSAYMMIEKMPSLVHCTGVAMDSSSAWLRRVSTGHYGVSRTGEWQELAYFYTAQPGESMFMLICGRYDTPYNPNPDSAIWLDDAYMGEGASLEQPPSPKRPFGGSRVRVDALGNFEVNREGSWEPFFPFAIYQASGQSFAKYSVQGFNCIMFNQFALRAVDRARAAVSSLNPHGMMSMIEIAQYTRPDMLHYNDVAGVGRQVAALNASSSADNVLAFYWDNEAWSEYDVPLAITEQIKRFDRDTEGSRIHPILMLQGDSGMFRQYNAMVDVGMAYDRAVDNFILQRVDGQQLPWTLAVLSDVEDPGVLRSSVYRELAVGARGIAFYRDPLSSGRRIDGLPIWQEFPKLRAEVDQLMPVLRATHWTSWTAAATSSDVTVGTRDYRGECYVILSNALAKPLDIEISLFGLPYTPSMLTDFFTGQQIPMTVKEPAGIVPVSLEAYGTAVYRIEMQRVRYRNP